MSQFGVNLILGSNDFQFLNLIIMSHFDNIIYARKITNKLLASQTRTGEMNLIFRNRKDIVWNF